MKKLKYYLVKCNVRGTILAIGIIIVLAAFICAFFQFNMDVCLFMGKFLLFIVLTIILILWWKNYRFNQMLCKLYNTPELQEELIKDFQGAETVFDGFLLIGKINIYIKDITMVRKELVGFFDYKMGDIKYRETGRHWDIYYVSKPEKKVRRVIGVGTRFYSEDYVRDEVNRANELLRNE